MMGISRTVALILPVMAFAVAGCQSERFSSMNTGPQATAPAPLTPAPAGTVEQSQLPPPSQPGTDPAANGQFPEAPEQQPVQQAAVQPSGGGADISKNGLVGSWKTSAGGGSCQMFLTLTKYGNASRGGTRGCSGDMANMRGWDVKGKQLVIYDESGNTIARLYSSGGERLDGQTSSGQAVSIFR